MKNEMQSGAYGSFASVYDMFMDNIPYQQWFEYICSLLREQGIEDGLVLELGCGTGSMTQLLAENGYDMIGVDCSPQMLQAAVEKREESGLDILYLLQDMREFELYGTVRAIVSICDSMNYLIGREELVRVLGLANNYLDPGGIFIFDLNTPYKYETVLGEQTIAENREAGSFIWENYYDPEERVNQYDLTLFVRQDHGLYRKYEETHFQYAFGLEEVKQAVREAGMELVAMYDAFTREPVREDSERVYVIVREQGKL